MKKLVFTSPMLNVAFDDNDVGIDAVDCVLDRCDHYMGSTVEGLEKDQHMITVFHLRDSGGQVIRYRYFPNYNQADIDLCMAETGEAKETYCLENYAKPEFGGTVQDA